MQNLLNIPETSAFDGEMPIDLPKYVNAERGPDGKVRIYFRRDKKSPRLRMPDPRNKKLWDETYARYLADNAKDDRKPQSGTLGWLIDQYRTSGHWAGLRASTRQARGNVLKRIAEESGSVPYAAIKAKHITEGMDRRKPHAANTFRKVMSQLFAWAVARELVEVNPCAPVKTRAIKSDGFHTWTVQEVERFWKRWPLGTRQRLAMDLLLFTGLRRSDAIIAGRQHIQDGVLSIAMTKTRKWVHIPIAPLLQQSIDATQTGDLALLCTGAGKPFTSAASFGNWFRDACVEAGVPGRAHGLRKAGATIAADNGATAHELMSMYGWQGLDEAEVYTRSANRKMNAARAGERIANAFAPNSDPNPLTPKKAE